jgi:hypothetical protein
LLRALMFILHGPRAIEFMDYFVRLIFLMLWLSSPVARAQNSSFSAAFWNTSAANFPTNLQLTHVANSRNFLVSWTGATGNGGVNGCKLQYRRNDTVWTDLSGGFNCDVNTLNAAAVLPGDNWTTNFNPTGVAIRLTRISGSVEMGIFPQRATCTAKSGSASPTPNIDENCNALWDDTSGGSPVVVGYYPAGPLFPTGSFTIGDTLTCPPAATIPGADRLYQLYIGSQTPVFDVFDDDSCTVPITYYFPSWSSGGGPYILEYPQNQTAAFSRTPAFLDYWNGGNIASGLYNYTDTSCQTSINIRITVNFYKNYCNTSACGPTPTGSIRYRADAPNFKWQCTYVRDSALLYW